MRATASHPIVPPSLKADSIPCHAHRMSHPTLLPSVPANSPTFPAHVLTLFWTEPFAGAGSGALGLCRAGVPHGVFPGTVPFVNTSTIAGFVFVSFPARSPS